MSDGDGLWELLLGVDVSNLQLLTLNDMGVLLGRCAHANPRVARAFCVLFRQWLDAYVTMDGWLLEFQPRLPDIIQLLRALKDGDVARDAARRVFTHMCVCDSDTRTASGCTSDGRKAGCKNSGTVFVRCSKD